MCEQADHERRLIEARLKGGEPLRNRVHEYIKSLDGNQATAQNALMATISMVAELVVEVESLESRIAKLESKESESS